jgi:hypothetical protein
MYRDRLDARLVGLLALLTGAAIGCAPSGSSGPDMGAMGSSPTAITPDGNGAILTANTVVNRYAVLGADAEVGATQIQLSTTTPVATLNLQPNDILLLYQAQGARIETRDSTSYGHIFDRAGAGSLELASVASVDVAQNQITLQGYCGGLQHDFLASRTQVIRVPQYQSLLVAASGSLAGKPWDGKSGGVVAVRVEGQLLIDGLVDASGIGFRGGASNRVMRGRIPNVGVQYRSTSSLSGGNKGESIAGSAVDLKETGQYGRGAPANGGGGGNNLLAGGGGGANGGEPTGWTGQGSMDTRPEIEPAWRLDPAYVANSNALTKSSGGGRGGYSLSQVAADPLVLRPEDSGWGGDLRRERGGLGGEPIQSDPGQALFFGGGGGGGDNFLSAGGAGGNGGGLILLVADEIAGSGSVRADGRDGLGTSDLIGGAGGGGGGGSVVLVANSAAGISVSARGGNGGAQEVAGLDAAGPGGGGGGGYVATTDPEDMILSVAPGIAGFTRSGPLQVFPPNGATAGSEGTQQILTRVPFGGVAFCTTADLEVEATSNASETTGRNPVTYSLTVTNLGPSPAEDPTVRFTLAPTSETLSVTAPGWTCSQTDTLVECSRHRLKLGEASQIQVQARPPLGREAGLSTARVSSVSVDPNRNNDVADVSIDINDPLSALAHGGGLSCGLAARSRSSPDRPWGVAFLLTLLLLRLRRRRAEGNT